MHGEAGALVPRAVHSMACENAVTPGEKCHRMLFEHGTCAPASPLGVSRELLRKEVKVTIKFAIITCSDTRTLETDEAGHVWFLTKNGGRLLYDDGKMKSHAELLENADIEDAMRQPYPLEPERPDFAPDEEPGRIRCYPLLKALYGADQRSVERGIVRTLFGGKTKVRLAAPAAEAFQRIDAAWRLRPADPELNSYFSPIYGYFWRAIAKTNRLSPHSFGIAVDLNPDKGPYWQWSKLRPHPLQKTFPSAIVSLFEDNGFIWGGKWEHFDLMHFEYRPELIIKAKKLRAQANGEKPEDAS